MKRCVWIFALLIGAIPVSAQDLTDETSISNIGAQFALGNLALRELTRSNGPVQQLKAFFADSRLPLTKDQEQALEGIVEAQQKSMRDLQDRVTDEKERTDSTRKLNQEYLRVINGVLTTEQQTHWRHYRIEQVQLRGGFPALKSMLEEANAPMSIEQQKSIQKIFENFAARRSRLAESNPNAGIAEIDRLVIAEFNRVVALLSTEQRNALQSLRRRSLAISRR